MRFALHIPLGLALATPAMALTPLPPCSGQMIEGQYEIWESYAEPNGFVGYYGQKTGTDKMLIVLEHCKTGKALVAQAHFDDDRMGDGQHLDDVHDVLSVYTESERNYTLRAIQRGLRGKGIKAGLKTYAAESCACSVYHPDDRGERKAFAY